MFFATTRRGGTRPARGLGVREGLRRRREVAVARRRARQQLVGEGVALLEVRQVLVEGQGRLGVRARCAVCAARLLEARAREERARQLGGIGVAVALEERDLGREVGLGLLGVALALVRFRAQRVEAGELVVRELLLLPGLDGLAEQRDGVLLLLARRVERALHELQRRGRRRGRGLGRLGERRRRERERERVAADALAEPEALRQPEALRRPQEQAQTRNRGLHRTRIE